MIVEPGRPIKPKEQTEERTMSTFTLTWEKPEVKVRELPDDYRLQFKSQDELEFSDLQ